jgi:hypothetical protein
MAVPPRPPPAPPIPGPDEDRGAQLVAAYVVGCAASLIFVALRFWSRISFGGLGADDWCMLVTAVSGCNVPLFRKVHRV